MTAQSQFGGFVLAGGKSTRMGRNKALIELAGIPLVLRTISLLDGLTDRPCIVGPPEVFGGRSTAVIPDDRPGLGPLGGIATALSHTDQPWNLILGCDMPFLTRDWLSYLLQRASRSRADVILPQSDSGPEPLCAVYRLRCSALIATALDRGVRKVTDGLAKLEIESVSRDHSKPFDSDGLLFNNMNSPADWEKAREVLEKKARV